MPRKQNPTGVKSVTKYLALDGSEHDTVEEAVANNIRQELEGALESIQSNYDDLDVDLVSVITSLKIEDLAQLHAVLDKMAKAGAFKAAKPATKRAPRKRAAKKAAAKKVAQKTDTPKEDPPKEEKKAPPPPPEHPADTAPAAPPPPPPPPPPPGDDMSGMAPPPPPGA